jgi:dCTP deaminase
LFLEHATTIAHRRTIEVDMKTTLSDQHIIEKIETGSLITNGDPAQASGASYELRLGNTYYDLTESDHPINVPAGGNVLIKPGHRVVLITHEEVLVPNDFLARIVSKGSLFSVGLSPVATYADPGFTGNLGIVTQNISDKYIVLPLLEPIAKVDFTELSGTAIRPYQGQHGFKTKIWPIKHQLQKTYAEICDDERVKTEKEEAYKLLPRATAIALRSLEKRRKFIDGAILIAVILNALTLFLVKSALLDGFLGVVGNLVASAIVGILVLYTRSDEKGA